MKDKIIVFVVGILLGAVISTGVCIAYSNSKASSSKPDIQMDGNKPPEMPNGQNNGNSNSQDKSSDNTSKDTTKEATN